MSAAAIYAAAGPPAATRTAEIQALRAAKAAHLKPERLPAPHRAFRYVQQRRIIDRVLFNSRGFNLLLEGLGPTSGFAMGPEYIRPGLFGGRGILRTSFVGSTESSYSGALALGFPRFAAGRLSLDFSGLYWNAPYLDYYGPGPASFKTGRTVYAMESTAFETRAAYRLTPHISAGGLARYLLFNVGPGRKSKYASTDVVFTPAAAPGIDEQTDFITPGAFLDFDWRRFPWGRRDGSRFIAEYSNFFDRGAGSFSFGRVNLDFRRYFAFLHGQRELALRAKAVLSGAAGSAGVPFYLQAQLGGADDLRGFRGRRFYDNNAFVLNAEYRWEIADKIDAAVFGDAGKVFPRLGLIQPLKRLEGAYGAGLRFRRGRDVFFRADVGFSREGAQLWLTFGDLF